MKKSIPQYLSLKSKWSVLFILCISLAFISGCGSVISQSTVKLSADVGSRLSEMEQLHHLAIQRYFDLERQKIEDFMTKTWEPLFLRNFLGTSQVLDKLQNASLIDEATQNELKEAFASYLTDTSEAEKATQDLIAKLNTSRKSETDAVKTVVGDYIEDDKMTAAEIHITSLLGTDEPAQIIFEFAEAAHVEMNARRESLLAPINQAESETLAELSASYAELIRGQSTITGRLEAAAKVSKEQDQLLSAFGINSTTKNLQAKLSNFTTGIDGALQVASSLTQQSGQGNLDFSNNILSTLETQIKKVTNPTGND